MFISKQLEEIIRIGCDAMEKEEEEQAMKEWRSRASDSLETLTGTETDIYSFMQEYERVAKAKG